MTRVRKRKRRTKQEIRRDKFLKALAWFQKEITKIRYNLVDPKDVAKDVLKEKLVKPDRVIDETYSQLSYEHVSRTGLKSYIHTNIIGDDFAESGIRSVGIVDMATNDIVFAREFLRDEDFKLLFTKLLAYAIWLQKITDNPPLCKWCNGQMHIAEPKINKGYVWRCDNFRYHLRGTIDRMFGKKELQSMPVKYRQLISKKEADIRHYFKVTRKKKGIKRFKRHITTTWKVYDYNREPDAI